MKKRTVHMILMLLTVILTLSVLSVSNKQSLVKGATIKSIKKKLVTGTYKGWVAEGKLGKIKYKKGITISWKKVKKAKKYQVEVLRYSPVREKWVRISKKTVKKPKYLLTNVEKGVEYKVRIRVKKGKKYSKWSKKFTVKPKKDYSIVKTDKRHNPVSEAKIDRFAAEEVYALQNAERVRVGVPEILWDENLYEICVLRAKEIEQEFTHDYSTIGEYIGNGNDGVHLGGENIAKGYDTPEKAVAGWISSSGHYRAMIDPEWKTGAVAVYLSGDSWFWVAMFYDYTSDELIELNQKYGIREFSN